MVGASLRGMPASCRTENVVSFWNLETVDYGFAGYRGTFNSIKVNPRPALTRRLYLIVGHRIIGRSLSIGRGATAAALEIRAALRRDLRPG